MIISQGLKITVITVEEIRFRAFSVYLTEYVLKIFSSTVMIVYFKPDIPIVRCKYLHYTTIQWNSADISNFSYEILFVLQFTSQKIFELLAIHENTYILLINIPRLWLAYLKDSSRLSRSQWRHKSSHNY